MLKETITGNLYEQFYIVALNASERKTLVNLFVALIFNVGDKANLFMWVVNS